MNNTNNASIVTITGFAIVTLSVFFSVMGGSVILNNRLTRFFGMCSYGMYLFNPLIIYILKGIGLYKNVMHYFTSYSFVVISISIAATIIITTFAALISHNYFEQPFINIGKKLIQVKG